MSIQPGLKQPFGNVSAQPHVYYKVESDALKAKLVSDSKKESPHGNTYVTLCEIERNIKKLQADDVIHNNAKTVASVKDIYNKYMDKYERSWSFSKIWNKFLNRFVRSIPRDPERVERVKDVYVSIINKLYKPFDIRSKRVESLSVEELIIAGGASLVKDVGNLLKFVPENNIEELFQNTDLLVALLTNKHLTVKILLLFSPEERMAKIKQVSAMVGDLHEKGKNCNHQTKNWFYVLSDLRLLPSELRLPFFEKLRAAEIDSYDTFLSEGNHFRMLMSGEIGFSGFVLERLFELDPKFRVQVLTYIEEQMDRSLKDDAVITTFAQHEVFSLYQDITASFESLEKPVGYKWKIKAVGVLYAPNLQVKINRDFNEARELFPEGERNGLCQNKRLLFGLSQFPKMTLQLIKLIPKELRTFDHPLLTKCFTQFIERDDANWEAVFSCLSILPEEFHHAVFDLAIDNKFVLEGKTSEVTNKILKTIFRLNAIAFTKTRKFVQEKFDRYLDLEHREDLPKKERDQLVLLADAVLICREAFQLKPKSILRAMLISRPLSKTRQFFENKFDCYLALEHREDHPKKKLDQLVLLSDAVLIYREALQLKPKSILKAMLIGYPQLAALFSLEQISNSSLSALIGNKIIAEAIQAIGKRYSTVGSRIYPFLAMFPESGRLANLEVALSFSQKIGKSQALAGGMNNIDIIARDLRMLPEEVRLQFMNNVISDKVRLTSNGCVASEHIAIGILGYLMKMDPNLLPKIHETIDNTLDQYLDGDVHGGMTALQRTEAYNFAKSLCYDDTSNFQNNRYVLSHYQPLLRLDPDIDHPILRKAAEVMLKFDPAAENNPKNPYYLLTKLKNIAKIEKRIKIGPTGSVALITVIDEQSNSTIIVNPAINFEELQERSKKNAYTVGMLPKLPEGFSLKFFEDIFNGLSQRLPIVLQDKPEEKKEFVNHLTLLMGVETEAGLTEFLKNKPPNQNDIIFLLNKMQQSSLVAGMQIPILFIVQGGAGDPISNYTFYLYAILKSIIDVSPDLKQGALLSQRETQVLNFLSSVQECSTGQQEGIAQYYNGLDDRYKQGNALLKDEERVEKLVEAVVERLIDELIVHPSTLGNLADIPAGQEVKQQVHQIRYIKNRFSHQLGLIYRYVFEQHPGVVANSLLACSESMDDPEKGQAAKEMLNRIIGLIPPQLLIDRLKNKFVWAANRAREITDKLDEDREEGKINREKHKQEKEGLLKKENLVTEQDIATFIRTLGKVLKKGEDVDWEKYFVYDKEWNFRGVSDTAAYQIYKKMKILLSDDAF